jgi:Carboxypeptidase regulatory-like domain
MEPTKTTASVCLPCVVLKRTNQICQWVSQFIPKSSSRAKDYFIVGKRQRLTARDGLAGAVALLMLFAFLISGNAQTTSGTILGTITEQSGSVIPSTPVQLINAATSAVVQTNTNDSGFYQFVDVPPGTYRIVVQKQGFKQLSRGPIELQVASRIEVDLSLEVGSSTETVEVTANTPLIEADTTSLGTVVDQRETNELPLNGRNPMNLTALVASVIPLGQTSGSPTGVNPQAWGNYQIGGGMAGQSVTFIDGAPDNDVYDNNTAIIPSQDSIQEFKVETNNLSAEYGRLAGGAINFTTKSGTEKLHGSAWEFIRNRVLNANTFYGNMAGLPTPAFTQNQYGFNFGGPVVIPKVYDGRRKTFFFVNWEGFALRQGQTYTNTVPTAAEVAGNLSALGVPIYDPNSTCGVGANVCGPGQNQYDRTLIPNATITNINPTAAAYLKNFYPAPNTAGVNGQNNYISNPSAGGNNYQTVVHIDHTLTDKQHLSARFTYWKNINLPVDPLGTGICGNGSCGELYHMYDFVIDDTYTISAKTILDLRLSYLRFEYARTPLKVGFSLEQLGMPASLASQVEFPGPPSMIIAGFDTAGIFNDQGADSTIVNASDNDRIAGTLTRFVGNHTFKFGGEYTRETFNYAQVNTSSGLWNFDSNFTSLNPTVANSGGAGLASFLLGYPASGSIAYADKIAAESLYPAIFGTDDWRITQNLTLHLGLRWEDTEPFTERHDRISYFDSNAPNPILAADGLGNIPGAVGLVNSSTRSSRFGMNNLLIEFSPRVGLSYRLFPNTVLTGGYGIFWLPNDVTLDQNPGWDADSSSTTTYTASTNGGLTPANNISNPFPQTGVVLPAGRNAAVLQQNLLGEGITELFPNNPFGYAQQWNVGIQQQVGNSTAISAAYAGSKGTHLPFGGLQMDQLPDQDLAQGNALLASVANPFYGAINPGYTLGAPTVTAGQLMLKYPQYSGVTSGGADWGDSTYNALEVKVQKRFPQGASINVAYTVSKLLSDTDTLNTWLESGNPGIQDSNNLRAEKSLSSASTPQRLVIAYVYDIPVGRGRTFLPDLPRAADYVIGGWGLQGLTTLMDGFPLGFTTGTNLTNSYGGGSRPNYVAGCKKGIGGGATSKLSEWFNTDCFTAPPAFTFGDEPRNDPQLKSPGVANWDAAVVKKFPIDRDGRVNLDFRAEFFNLFNRVQFGYPGTTQGVSGFGVISSQANNPRIVQFALRLSF